MGKMLIVRNCTTLLLSWVTILVIFTSSLASQSFALNTLDTRLVITSWDPYPSAKSYRLTLTTGASTQTYETDSTTFSIELPHAPTYSAFLQAITTDNRVSAPTEAIAFSVLPLRNLFIRQGDRLISLNRERNIDAQFMISNSTKFLSLQEHNDQVFSISAANKNLNWNLINTLESDGVDIGAFGIAGEVPVNNCLVKGKATLVVAKKKGNTTRLRISTGKEITLNGKFSSIFCSEDTTSTIIAVAKDLKGIRFVTYDLNSGKKRKTSNVVSKGVPFIVPGSNSVAGVISKDGSVSILKGKKIIRSKSLLPSGTVRSIHVGEKIDSRYEIIVQYSYQNYRRFFLNDSTGQANEANTIPLPQGELLGLEALKLR